MTGDLISLQRLHLLGYCLDRKVGIQLPPSLQWLSVRFSCLQDVGELAGMFPDLEQSASSRAPWTLHMLDLSFNRGLKMASSGSLSLEGTELEAVAAGALGLQKLSVLSAWTATAELPAGAVAHFELQGLSVGTTKTEYLSQEALASCHSLKTLGLQDPGLAKLPPGFLAAMPRLQRLNLARNQLQSTTLCADEIGDVSGLVTLNLAGNGLCILPLATFSCLPHFRELLLQDNHLLSLDGQLFQDLQQLSLDTNPLLTLGGNWLAALSALTTLSLLGLIHPDICEPRLLGSKESAHLEAEASRFLCPSGIVPAHVSDHLRASSSLRHDTLEAVPECLSVLGDLDYKRQWTKDGHPECV